jgi:hypothetical protein
MVITNARIPGLADLLQDPRDYPFRARAAQPNRPLTPLAEFREHRRRRARCW